MFQLTKIKMMQKKGVSEIVGYVLLIVIALALSVFVYSYLKLYTPKDAIECPVDISLVVTDYKCSGEQLNLTLMNKGLFKVYGAYVRFGAENKTVLKSLTASNDSLFYFIEGNQPGLLPGNKTIRSYSLNRIRIDTSPATFAVEVQPAIYDKKNRVVACNNAVVTRTIHCD